MQETPTRGWRRCSPFATSLRRSRTSRAHALHRRTVGIRRLLPAQGCPGFVLTELSDDAIDLIDQKGVGRSPGASEYELVYLDILPMSGAVSRVEPAAAAFAERAA